MPVTRSGNARHSSENHDDDAGCTTNEEDLREAAALQARLALAPHRAGHALSRTPPPQSMQSRQRRRLPSVQLASGAHKYVLLYGVPPDSNEEPPTRLPTAAALGSVSAEDSSNNERDGQYLVVSRRGAAYHRNVADPVTTQMEEAGYTFIQIRGGGRIALGKLFRHPVDLHV
jgi:hypothetical protein